MIFRILDVGCNEGDLTLAMVLMAREQLEGHNVEVEGVGIDIDAELIDRATRKASSVASGVSFYAFDCMEEVDQVVEKFKGKYELCQLVLHYHVDTLNHGDAGLEAFLKLSASLLVATCDNAALLVEPQPWRVYRNAAQRARKLGLPEPKYWSKLSLRNPDVDISRIVEGLGTFRSILILGREMRGRQLAVYLAGNESKKDGASSAPTSHFPDCRLLKDLVREASEESHEPVEGAKSKRKQKREQRALQKKQKIDARQLGDQNTSKRVLVVGDEAEGVSTSITNTSGTMVHPT